MSRLFESFGDDADDADFPFDSLVDEAALRDVALAEGESPLLAGSLGSVSAGGASDDSAETASQPDDDYEIPDFERDAKDLENYDDAMQRHIRQQTATAETAIQASFQQKREQLQREIKNARSFEDDRRATAIHTTRQYANRYPLHVDKRGVQPPTFLENVFSIGSAGRLYRAAFIATEALEQLRTAMRKREEQLGTLESQLTRALYLKEESIKKSMETEAGLADFNERTEVAPLYKRVQSIHRERARFAERLERGEVSDKELRDRAMSEFNLRYAELPLMGAIIAKVARYGRLSYFQLRDLEKKESLLSYDPRLDSLRNSVVDVYSVAGAVTAKLKRNDNGTAFRVADHFKVCWRNGDKAEERYGQHRSALREDRGLAPLPPRDENEAEIIERLAALAALVDGGQARDPMPPATLSAPIRNAP